MHRGVIHIDPVMFGMLQETPKGLCYIATVYGRQTGLKGVGSAGRWAVTARNLVSSGRNFS